MNKRLNARFRTDLSLKNITDQTLWSDEDNVVILNYADGEPVPQEISTSSLAFWNWDGLFILLKGKYRELRISNSPNDAKSQSKRTLELWEKSDVYEFFIGDGDEREYYEFILAPDGKWLSAKIKNDKGLIEANYDDGPDFENISSIVEDENSWYGGFHLSNEFLIKMGKQEKEYSVNIYRASGKFHGDDLLAWSPTGYGINCFHRANKFGKLNLSQ